MRWRFCAGWLAALLFTAASPAWACRCAWDSFEAQRTRADLVVHARVVYVLSREWSDERGPIPGDRLGLEALDSAGGIEPGSRLAVESLFPEIFCGSANLQVFQPGEERVFLLRKVPLKLHPEDVEASSYTWQTTDCRGFSRPVRDGRVRTSQAGKPAEEWPVAEFIRRGRKPD